MDVCAIVAAGVSCVPAWAVVTLLAVLATALSRRGAGDRVSRGAEARHGGAGPPGAPEATRARADDRDATPSIFRVLATVSHEIRTPLSSILGMVDLLRRAALSSEQASHVEAIHASGAALIALVDQLLDLGRMEAGRLELAEDVVDLRGLVEGVVGLLAPRARAKGLEIAASVSPAAPAAVRADAIRLRQVLVNLAGNAVKFTPRGGVRVAVEPDAGDGLRFAVIDTGPGVPPDRRAAIFEEFERGEGARDLEGAGLGLSISRRLVRLMGGTLTVADNPGGGAIFAFTIPGPGCAGASLAASAPDIAGVRALAVAGSPFDAPALASRLAEAGATVAHAEGAGAGLAALAAPAPPDVVIVDRAPGRAVTDGLAEALGEVDAPKSQVLLAPFEPGEPGPAHAGFDRGLVAPERARALAASLAAALARATSARRAAPAASPWRHALVAEDSDVGALIAETALRRLGFEPVRARDGDEAVRRAAPRRGEAPPFDLILMDLRMPGMDGPEAARRLRRLERETGARPTPIIGLSADGLAARPPGCDALLVKPFDADGLAATIARLQPSSQGPRDKASRAS